MFGNGEVINIDSQYLAPCVQSFVADKSEIMDSTILAAGI
jgi:hypothetical protein